MIVLLQREENTGQHAARACSRRCHDTPHRRIAFAHGSGIDNCICRLLAQKADKALVRFGLSQTLGVTACQSAVRFYAGKAVLYRFLHNVQHFLHLRQQILSAAFQLTHIVVYKKFV